MYVFLFKVVLGYSSNNHLGYAVNPLAIHLTIHWLPFPASLPYHLEVIPCLIFKY